MLFTSIDPTQAPPFIPHLGGGSLLAGNDNFNSFVLSIIILLYNYFLLHRQPSAGVFLFAGNLLVICWRYFFMPSVFGKKGTFSKRHLTSLVKMAVFTKFYFTSSALPAPSARLPCQQGGEWKFPGTAAAAHPAGAVPRRRCWPAVLFSLC